MKVVRVVSTSTSTRSLLMTDGSIQVAVPTSFRLKQHVGMCLSMISGYRMQMKMDSANVISIGIYECYQQIKR